MKTFYEKITKKRIKLKFYDVDPIMSKAYVTSSTSFSIKVNDQKITNKLVQELTKIQGIRRVYLKNQIFNGPVLDRLPDIYIEPDFDNGYYLGTNKISGIVVKPRKILNHHPLGVFWMKRWEFNSDPPSIIANYDVTNIIMAYLGLPLSNLADNIELIRKILGSDIRLSSTYINRWRLMKKILKL